MIPLSVPPSGQNPRSFGIRASATFRTLLHYLPSCPCGSVATQFDRTVVAVDTAFTGRHRRCDDHATVHHVDLPYGQAVRDAYAIILEATSRPSVTQLPADSPGKGSL